MDYAFRGIQAGVVYLILSAGVKMLKSMKKNPLSFVIFCSVLICMVAFSIFSISFSAIFFILICGVIGLVAYSLTALKNKEKEGESK